MFNYDGVLKLTNELKDFIGEEELEYIIEKLKYVDDNYDEEQQAIGLAFETETTIHISSHILSFIIINKYRNSNRYTEILAVAIAFSREGAYYRKKAIEFFERYFDISGELNLSSNYIECDFGVCSDCQRQSLYSNWHLHSILSDLYEKEYEFEKAITQLEYCIQCSKGSNPADFTRIGDILIKADITKAENFYRNLIQSKYYPVHKYAFDCAYKNLNQKIADGYVYKPRKSKKNNSISNEQCLAITAANCFI